MFADRLLADAIATGNAVDAGIAIAGGADLRKRGRKNETILMSAAAAGNEKIVGHILEKDMEIDTKDDEGLTAFLHACSHHRAVIARMLAGKGADVAAEDAMGATGLHLALLRKQQAPTKFIEVLIKELRQDVKRRDLVGRTALMIAWDRGHIQAAELILNAGGDPNAVDDYGKNVWRYCFHDTPNKLGEFQAILKRHGARW